MITSVLQLERSDAPQSQLEREPAEGKRENRERPETERRAQERPGLGPSPRSGERQQRHGADDVEETQNQAKRPAEAADDFAGVLLLEIRIQRAQADGQTGERYRHHGDCSAEIN